MSSDHYEAGGRTITEGPYGGGREQSAGRAAIVKGVDLTDQERADLVAFLESLTDTAFMTDPRLADPRSGVHR